MPPFLTLQRQRYMKCRVLGAHDFRHCWRWSVKKGSTSQHGRCMKISLPPLSLRIGATCQLWESTGRTKQRIAAGPGQVPSALPSASYMPEGPLPLVLQACHSSPDVLNQCVNNDVLSLVGRALETPARGACLSSHRLQSLVPATEGRKARERKQPRKHPKREKNSRNEPLTAVFVKWSQDVGEKVEACHWCPLLSFWCTPVLTVILHGCNHDVVVSLYLRCSQFFLSQDITRGLRFTTKMWGDWGRRCIEVSHPFSDVTQSHHSKDVLPTLLMYKANVLSDVHPQRGAVVLRCQMSAMWLFAHGSLWCRFLMSIDIHVVAVLDVDYRSMSVNVDVLGVDVPTMVLSDVFGPSTTT